MGAKTVCTFSNLLTADQVITTYQFAGMTEDLIPRKGRKTLLVPTGKVYFSIAWDSRKSTYGKRLFLCEHLENAEVSE
jgi:hypothetical protein